MTRLHSALVLLIVLLVVFNPLAAGQASPGRQALLPEEQAAALLSRLTPEERVGQLFLVTFKGTQVGLETQVRDLIATYHVGGVMLLAANDNFTGERPLNEVLALTRQLQLNKWEASQQSRLNAAGTEEFKPAFIPLLIGLPQEGDGYPYDQILSGLTPLPNLMAMGSTWNQDLAKQVGAVLGQELAALGINLLLGPSLDVLEDPRPESTKDLGTRTFGGDPFWVGKLGSGYIEGVHTGSQNRVAVIAKHFPGHGGSDRLPEEEVAFVRKSLEQLKSFELAPFFAVTGNAPSQAGTADGLLVSHIRYQGLQGSRTTTRPVSFDPQALNLVMSFPPLDSWRQKGGVMISDNLGNRAVRRFYETTSQEFNMPRRVALNAFFAGNDLLYVDDFSSGGLDSHASAIQTLSFFTQKYREDLAFQQQVDESVLRILTLKYRLYGTFTPEKILAPEDGPAEIGRSSQITFQVAREGATLISPSQADLEDTAPDPPDRFDRIVFITDTRTGKQCSDCPPQPLLAVKDLEGMVLRRYGPQAGGQVSPNNLSSYSLADLQAVLDAEEEEDTQLELDLTRAHWVVFAMLDTSKDVPSYQTLNRFLTERPDLFQKKRLIVFAFNAPYYLDATNISKLTAFYGLYSKAPQFVDMAAYLLFRELPPAGSLPITVLAVGYDLNTALFPDPNRVIPLELDLVAPPAQAGDSTVTPEPVPTPDFRVGSVIPVRTGVILDHNGHPVQDGTQVEFILSMGGEERPPRQVETTVNGLAHTTFQVTNSGILEIRAESEPARQSTILRFEIPSMTGEVILPTATEQPTATPSPSPTPTATETALPVIQNQPLEPPPVHTRFGDWVLATLVTTAIALSSFRLAVQIGLVRWGLRGALLALIGGLIAYSYLALRLPGSETVLNGSISRGVLLVTLVGAGLGLLAAWSWRTIEVNSRQQKGLAQQRRQQAEHQQPGGDPDQDALDRG